MMRQRGQPRRFRPFFTLVLLAMVAGAIMYLRCGDELGLGGGSGSGVGDGDGKGDVVKGERSDESGEKSDVRPAVGSAARKRARCELRLDAGGLSLDGSPTGLEKAVKECKDAGGAELTVTGDALFGESEKVRKALDEAGVEVFVREGAVPER
jgi:hypothetical protein